MATPTPNQQKPLGLPRLTGNPQSDYPVLVEYLYGFWRVVTSNYLNQSDVGPTVQPTAEMLTALSPLIPAADKLPYTTSATTAALTDFTAFARTFLDDADAATARATLGLGALAQLNTVSTAYIDDDAVTYGKFQNLTTNGIVLGRSTVGAGNVEELTIASLGAGIDHTTLTNLNSATHTHLTSTNHTDLTDGGQSSLHGHPANLINIASVGTPVDLVSVQDYIRHGWSAGITEGGALTDNGNGTVSIASGEGAFRISALDDASLITSPVAAYPNMALTDNAVNYVYADYNAGSPVFGVTLTESVMDEMTKTRVYVIAREGITLYYIDLRGQNVDHAAKHRSELYAAERFRHAYGGCALGEIGTRNVTVTAGEFFYGLSHQNHPNINTSTGDTFVAYYRNGLGGFTKTTGNTQIDNAYYDNGTGTLALLGGSKYGVFWIYLIIDSPTILAVQYGQSNYANIAAAEAAPVPTAPPTLTGVGVLIGRIIIQNGAAAFTDVSSAFSQVFVPSSATDHAGLANLVWTSSGHTGTATRIASFNGSGVTAELTYDTANTASAMVQRDASGNFSAGTITASLTGNASGSSGSCTGNSATATLAATVTVVDSTSATCNVALFDAATGSLAAKTDAGLTYAATTGVLTATGFAGPLTGNVTGNVSGSSGSCTGLAATATTLATPRAIYGNNFDGSAALTQIIASTYGGTGNGFTKFTGPTTAERVFTLPDATATILTSNAAVTIAQGGTGQVTAQAAIDALTAVTAATNEHVLTKDTATGNAIWKASAGGTGISLATARAVSSLRI